MRERKTYQFRGPDATVDKVDTLGARLDTLLDQIKCQDDQLRQMMEQVANSFHRVHSTVVKQTQVKDTTATLSSSNHESLVTEKALLDEQIKDMETMCMLTKGLTMEQKMCAVNISQLLTMLRTQLDAILKEWMLGKTSKDIALGKLRSIQAHILQAKSSMVEQQELMKK